MGPADSVSLDEKVGDRSRNSGSIESNGAGRCSFDELIVILFAAVIFLGCIISPPSLMDDVDAVQAQIARTMLKESCPIALGFAVDHQLFVRNGTIKQRDRIVFAYG